MRFPRWVLAFMATFGLGPSVLAGASGAASAEVRSYGDAWRPAMVRSVARITASATRLAPLKVGVLLPLSGAQAGIGQDCRRGVELALDILDDIGMPALDVMSADTESNVEMARSRAERLIADGAQFLIGAFDSSQTMAVAQVAERKGIPLVINIAASPALTEQGYRFVFRNFPTASMILGDAFGNQKEVFAAIGKAPKSVVFMHVNDTFGVAIERAVRSLVTKFSMPYTIADTIKYDPTARDLSVDVAKAKASGADALLVVSRLNDAILITRELVKQRWSPMGILSMGPGWYEDQYLKVLGKFSDGPLSFVPWYDPNKAMSRRLAGAIAQKFPGISLNTNHVYTFEALLVAADAYRRAGSTDPTVLADAIRASNIVDNVSAGPGIRFNAKGQNDALKNSVIQNQAGRLVTVAPKASANARPRWPMVAYDRR